MQHHMVAAIHSDSKEKDLKNPDGDTELPDIPCLNSLLISSSSIFLVLLLGCISMLSHSPVAWIRHGFSSS